MKDTYVRGQHPACYRAGEWARIVQTVTARERDCWLVLFEDGKTDTWVIDDPWADYEICVTEGFPAHAPTERTDDGDGE